MGFKRELNRKQRSCVIPRPLNLKAGLPLAYDAFELAYRYLNVSVGAVYEMTRLGIIQPKGFLGLYRLYFFDHEDLQRAQAWLASMREKDPHYMEA